MTRRIAILLAVAVLILGTTLACGCATSGLGKGTPRGPDGTYDPPADIYVRFSTPEENLTGRGINGVTFYGYPMVVIINPRLWEARGDPEKYELFRTTVHEFWHVIGWDTHGSDPKGFSYYQALMWPRIYEPNAEEVWGAKNPPLGWGRSVWVWDEDLIPVVADAVRIWNTAAGGNLLYLKNKPPARVLPYSMELEILTLD